MFKKFKDRLSEVSEEVKKDPRFQNSLASVNSLAEKTVAVIKNDQALRGSRESLNSQIGKKISYIIFVILLRSQSFLPKNYSKYYFSLFHSIVCTVAI